MSPIYTVRFGGGSFDAPAWHTVFTPDPGYTWILRDLCLSNDSGAEAEVAVLHLITGAGQPVVLFSVPTLAANTSIHLDLRQELLVGETVQAYCGSTFWSVALTGYRFLGENPRVGVLPAQLE